MLAFHDELMKQSCSDPALAKPYAPRNDKGETTTATNTTITPLPPSPPRLPLSLFGVISLFVGSGFLIVSWCRHRIFSGVRWCKYVLLILKTTPFAMQLPFVKTAPLAVGKERNPTRIPHNHPSAIPLPFQQNLDARLKILHGNHILSIPHPNRKKDMSQQSPFHEQSFHVWTNTWGLMPWEWWLKLNLKEFPRVSTLTWKTCTPTRDKILDRLINKSVEGACRSYDTFYNVSTLQS